MDVPMRFTAIIALITASVLLAQEKPLSGPELIAGAKAGRPSGSLVIRAQMEQQLNGKRTNVLNVQIKRRSTGPGSGDQLYQVTYSKNPELKGAALLLHTNGNNFSGAVFSPGKGVRKLTNADRHLSLFSTDMTVEDVLADFMNWTRHEIIGHEKSHDKDCAIIESKPSGSSEGINKVKSWVEMKRYIPWRVEIYEAGQDNPVRIEATERVLRGGSGYWFPREFTISSPAKGTVTRVEGKNSDNQPLTDEDFTEAAMQKINGK